MNYQNQMGFVPVAAVATLATNIKPIIGKAKDILNKVGPVLQGIFGRKKEKDLLAQAGQYTTANTQLRSEIATLDTNISAVTAQSNQIATELKRYGVNGFNGFGGLFDFLKRKTTTVKAAQQVNTAKQQYEALTAERDEKLSTLANMLEQIDVMQKRLEQAISEKKSSNTIMAVGIGALVLGGLYVASKKSK